MPGIAWPRKGYSNTNIKISGFLLRFEIARTIVVMAGTKNGGRAAISGRSAKSG